MITNEDKLVNALAYAEFVKGLCERKRTREIEIEHLRNELGLSSVALGDRVSTSTSADSIPNAVVRLQGLVSAYLTDLVEYVDEINGFITCLDQLDTISAHALYARYVRLLMWKEVADEMGYSERNVYNVREEGLIALFDVMPDYWRTAVV